jgi:DNA-directed RNA polymerase
MTTVYGVTFIGARSQIERQLKDRADIPHEECWNAASYLAKIVCLLALLLPHHELTFVRLRSLRASVICSVARRAFKPG